MSGYYDVPVVSAYAVECDLSEALASLMGCDTVSENVLVRLHLWVEFNI